MTATTTETTKTPKNGAAACPAALELVNDDRHSGTAPCTLPVGHEGEHQARFTVRTGDVRSTSFYDPERVVYDVGRRSLVVNKLAGESTPAVPAARSKSEAKRIAAQTSPPASIQIASIALEDLVESPFNKRRVWGDLKELAASMGNGVGILEPLLARPMGKKLELVFGHRRLRAAKRAGLEAAPVMIRELADDAALEMQAIENLQRVDLTILEEAEQYEQLVEMLHWSAEEIAAKIGKSKGYVYGRLKLCELGPEGRKAFGDGELTASVALYVSRVPASLQVDCLEALRKEASGWQRGRDGDDDKPLPLSAREATDLIQDRYMLRLTLAPFPVADAELVPQAGTCLACPKRSGNQRELFADVRSEDVCTDPVCFGEKRAAYNGQQAKRLVAKGIHVVEAKVDRFGNVKAPSGYARLTDHCSAVGKPFSQIVEKARAKAPRTPGLKELQQKVVMLDDRGKSVEIVKTKGLLEAAGVKPRAEASRSSTFDHKAYQAKRELEDKSHKAVIGAMVDLVENADGGILLDVLRLLVDELQCAWRFELDRTRKPTAKASESELAAMLVELVFIESTPKDLDAACKKLGVNAAAIRKRVEAEVLEAKGQVPPEPEPEKSKKASTKGRKK